MYTVDGHEYVDFTEAVYAATAGLNGTVAGTPQPWSTKQFIEFAVSKDVDVGNMPWELELPNGVKIEGRVLD